MSGGGGEDVGEDHEPDLLGQVEKEGFPGWAVGLREGRR